MTKKLVVFGLLAALLLLVLAVPAMAKKASKGYDEFGYNYQARVFAGPADGVDRVLDGMVWGDPLYAKDHLVMKWSKAWDRARYHDAPWTPKAWCTNQWNGMVPGGSDSTEHFKCFWVGPELEASPYWREGGVAIWGEFETIMDHGQTPDEGHVWWTHAMPAGLGAE